MAASYEMMEKYGEAAKYYEKAAKLFGCHFIDAGKIISSSDLDGLHFEAEAHIELGKAIADKIKTIL